MQGEEPAIKQPDNANAQKPSASQTLMRGLDILEAVADGVDDIADLARKTGMTYSTAHRILSALQQRHYIKREQGGSGYRLGWKVLELGYRAYSQVDLTRLAHPILKRLARETSDTVHLAYAETDKVIYLDKLASRRAVEISSRIGGVKPMISTGIGKALILDYSDDELLGIYDRSVHLLRDVITPAQWLQMMREYQRKGFAYDLGEDEQLIRCVAAPVRDNSRKIIAAISVSSTLEYMDEQRMSELVPLVQRAAAQISAELGG
ncbi:IclR family transcriptional regulator [Alcaligenaceae bacterium]|nr:IclR family transcriptional regulator [Alcaligenaceae bacterium]